MKSTSSSGVFVEQGITRIRKIHKGRIAGVDDDSVLVLNVSACAVLKGALATSEVEVWCIRQLDRGAPVEREVTRFKQLQARRIDRGELIHPVEVVAVLVQTSNTERSELGKIYAITREGCSNRKVRVEKTRRRTLHRC